MLRALTSAWRDLMTDAAVRRSSVVIISIHLILRPSRHDFRHKRPLFN